MRNITLEDRENARRLKNLWNAKKADLGLTQVKAAEKLGFNQGSVAQYLNCHIALNYEATIKFAKLLRVEPWEIDPSLGQLRKTVAPDEATKEVPVTRTMSGDGSPTRNAVRTRYHHMLEQCYGVEVDNDLYRGFAKRGSTIVASRAEEAVEGDDVVITYGDGSLGLAELVDIDSDGVEVIKLTTHNKEFLPYADIKRIDPIVDVVRPQRKRPARLYAVS